MSAARSLSLVDPERFALARSLVESRSLAAAVERIKLVQADPIRAPARANACVAFWRFGEACCPTLGILAPARCP